MLASLPAVLDRRRSNRRFRSPAAASSAATRANPRGAPKASPGGRSSVLLRYRPSEMPTGGGPPVPGNFPRVRPPEPPRASRPGLPVRLVPECPGAVPSRVSPVGLRLPRRADGLCLVGPDQGRQGSDRGDFLSTARPQGCPQMCTRVAGIYTPLWIKVVDEWPKSVHIVDIRERPSSSEPPAASVAGAQIRPGLSRPRRPGGARRRAGSTARASAR